MAGGTNTNTNAGQNLKDLLKSLSNDYDAVKGELGGDNPSDALMNDFYLKSIDTTLKQMASGNFQSQSAARDAAFNRKGPFGQQYDIWAQGQGNFGGGRRKGFIDEFEQSILEGLLGSDFKKQIGEKLELFADVMGVNIEDLTSEVGKRLGKKAMDAVQRTAFGQGFTNASKTLFNSIVNDGGNIVTQLLGSITGSSEGAAAAAAAGSTAISASFANIASAALQFSPYLIALGVGLHAADVVLTGFTDTVKAGQGVFQAWSKAGDRFWESRRQAIKSEQERYQSDVKTIIEYPFQILEDSAKRVEESWDSVIRTINATQGYDKTNLQDLMSSYSQRLRAEGLDNVIPGTDIYDNLAKVLEAGLSGKIAEEFAYQATKYGAAVPTQNFFDYASTYASVAANAMAAGKSQAEAITAANESLKDFTNNLLYASRQLAGGLSTGLNNAASLYEQSVKIVNAAHEGDATQISGVLTAIAAQVGAIAPDLSSSITDAVYAAATGGNSSELVALRSLAGVNASNTEFLKALARNPQQVFSTMFSNLATMYKQSNDAFMEKAEGYASLFGLSSESFQRIDFAALAESIRSMDTSSQSLSQNMQLLLQGQTTTTAEQLKAQQINQYMIDEGLSYVLDNEAARAIQQHMWEEQLARELQETTYGVEIEGKVAEFVEVISSSVQKIINLLNPLAWINPIGNIVATRQETKALKADIEQVLQLGKVGAGNAKEFQNLITRGSQLNLTRQLVDLLGGQSRYAYERAATDRWNRAIGNVWSGSGLARNLFNTVLPAIGIGRFAYELISGISPASTNSTMNYTNAQSRYTWGSVTKSNSNMMSALLGNAQPTKMTTSALISQVSAASQTATVAQARIEKMLDKDYVSKYLRGNYEDWVATASQFDIEDFSQAAAAAGYTEASLRDYFNEMKVEEGYGELQSDREREQKFWETGTYFWETRFWEEFSDPMITNTKTMIDQLSAIIENQQAWSAQFDEAFVQQWIQTAWNNEWVQEAWKNNWLTENWQTMWLDKAWSQHWLEEAWAPFYDEWMKYFIRHDQYYGATYTQKYNRYTGKMEDVRTTAWDLSTVAAIKNKENAQVGDAIIELAALLNDNLLDMNDPQVQTNALLAQILAVVGAIMQQNNGTPVNKLFPMTFNSLVTESGQAAI